MKVELDALRLIIAKEHSFTSKMRYLDPGHEAMVPLLISFTEYFKSLEEPLTQDEKREIRLSAIGNVVQRPIESFYNLTSWELSSITNFLKELNEEQDDKANKFIEYLSNGA